MRRALSIVLIVFFGLGPLSATLQAASDSRLPACCRRNGAHHCAMSRALLALMQKAVSGSTTVVSAPPHCPYFPGHVRATVGPFHAMAPSRSAPAAPLY